MKFFNLFRPFQIKDMVVSNRIIMPAMHLNLGRNGYMTKKMIAFYEERARGGAGMIIVGGCYVDIYGKGLPSMIAIDDDKYLPKLKKFTEAIHKAREDVKVCCQLYHGGAYAFPQIIGKTPIAPSAVYSNFSKTTPRKMTMEDIEREQQAFADAAKRAQKAGFDAVEICANAGYLMDQFISPKTNKRKDKYGGSLENRLRFPLETIELMHSKVDDFTIGYRISGDDFVPGSNTYKEKRVIGQKIAQQVDYMNVTGGWHETKVPQLPMTTPEGCFAYLAEMIKKRVSIPVFASNRINNPKLAEEILMARKADAVCIGRGLIADPYLPEKAKRGELRDIMNCIACNQGCFDNVFRMMPVTCLRNARAGNETRMKLNPLKEKKRIMVVGSGPAGLEASRVAAMRGHEVHLFEKDDKIGGLLNVIWIPPGRSEFKRMIEDYTYWIQKYGINLHLEEKVDIAAVKAFEPDFVFVATGSIPIKPPIKGIDRENVYWANDVFTGDAPVGKNNVVIGGGATGVECALYLAKYGTLSLEALDFLTFYDALPAEKALEMRHKGRNNVEVLEKLPKVGSALGKTTKWVILDKCDAYGVKFHTGVNVTEVGDTYVQFKDSSENEIMINEVDYVYYATGVKSNDSLHEKIKQLDGIKSKTIGDARTPQTVMEAVSIAYKKANRLF